NDLAYHLVVGVAMVLASASSATTRLRKFAWLGLLAPIGYGVLLTQSRTGMFAALAVVLFYVLRSVKRAVPLVIGGAIVLATLVMMSPSNPWRARTDAATAYGEDASARGRYDAWRTGVNMVKDRPLTGVGAGAFMIAWPEYAPGDVGDVRSEHNTWIQLVSELGFPALFLFLTVIGAAGFGTLHASKVKGPLQPIARGVQAGLVGFLICSVWGGIAWTWPIYLLASFAFAVRRLDASAAVVANRIDVVNDERYATMSPVPALAGRR
ncbi:MAG TPA: O-antigen ligase family protein, partial [Polyangia bacterium]|nr:O-antigen ligase family protein [Polyangia bacterium]